MFENSKSAPVSAVLKELLEDKKLTNEQLISVLENRREILVRCMKTFSQKTLGQLACLDSGDGSCHELYKDNPRVISLDNKFRLDTRGLYAGNLFSRRKGGQLLAFGIDQESWLLVKIKYSDEGLNRVWPNKQERATSVQVIRAELPTILQEMEIDALLVWSYFQIITDEWVSLRKALYERALLVSEGMKRENAILCLIA